MAFKRTHFQPNPLRNKPAMGRGNLCASQFDRITPKREVSSIVQTEIALESSSHLPGIERALHTGVRTLSDLERRAGRHTRPLSDMLEGSCGRRQRARRGY
ncbi:hypothetical protein GGX14DRAFT_392573 [Mycena pura]|uniref:Uncharacterized protein n=1 Tax=Mycena pura TaxID=153505 RepID=A0AAD6VMN9_9AGAR|nr:hypothetical protein GGX14DRAFT_392573 [Mycena pura]